MEVRVFSTAPIDNSWVYDVENRLVAARGLYAANLRYDPLGRLHETVTNVDDNIPANDITVRRLYDGGALVAEYDQTGAMLRRYVHGPNTGADTPLVWYEGPTMPQAAARMLNTDLQGSVTSVTDFGGAPIAINRYDEYGRPQSGNLGRFQYTGQAWLPEIGLYYYKARMYSPTLGRFMQTDPIGYADGVNWYNYVGGDPVNFVNPSGLFRFPKNEGIPSIVVNGRRSRSLCELSPDLCTGPVINAGLTGILNIDFDLGQIVVTACGIFPDASTTTLTGGLGGIGSINGSVTRLLNYKTGNISVYATGGYQVGWNGAASATLSSGAVYNLGDNNANYSGAFTGANASIPGIPVGINGQTGGGVTEVGIHGGVNLTPLVPSGGVTRSITSQPLNVGNIATSGTLLDKAMMAAKNIICNGR